MPYIVTTKRPATATLTHTPMWEVSRRAVATLVGAIEWAISDESRTWANEPRLGPRPENWQACLEAVYTVPESGGTVGPLPDGTLIDVEPVPWAVLSALTGEDDSEDDILAVFNAR
jgi:hypothetical protein